MPSKTPKFDAALDKILADLTPHTRTCTETGESFEITERDIEMFKLLRVPPPQTTWWARLRQKRMFVGGFNFFRRALTDGKSVVSMYDPESYVKILAQAEWNSDSFDPAAYAQAADPNRTFFEQWDSLSRNVPRPAIMQDPKSVNCEYAMYVTNSKNCYYALVCYSTEDALYVDMCAWCKNVVECTVSTRCEWGYNLVQCNECSRTSFSERCDGCVNVQFSLSCRNCTDCFGCTNQKNKRFCFLNEQLTEEEYRHRMSQIDLTDRRVVEEWKQKIAAVWAGAYRKSSGVKQSERAVGDLIEDSRDVEGISIFGSERTYHGFGMVGGGKDTMDFTSSTKCERSYGVVRTMNAYENRMTLACDGCIGVEYSELMTSCENCFGCIGLRHKKFNIFNTQYTEEEYWPIVDAIKAAMLERGEYGEFFGHHQSPFAYNTSHTTLLFPIEEAEAKRIDARWYDFANEKSSEAVSVDGIPDRLADTGDDILAKRFRCPVSGRAFGFVKPELEFHRALGIALPRVHPIVRQQAFAAQLLPFRLFMRSCDFCGKNVETRIPPSHKAPVFCPECYEAISIGEKMIPGVH